jgi:hypothetical protein
LSILVAILLFIAPAFCAAETTHEVHFKGTESELDVYFIRGKEAGPTVLLVGGIQGNEPGGYLAADLYADISLKRGNMIVVPRANFMSIVKNSRGVRGDMNRKFAANGEQHDGDVRVVDVIKRLMEQSDFFINLHDGSGFFAPKWESPLRNPMRYGQSVIADSEELTRPDGKVLQLGLLVSRVLDKVNPQIGDSGHIFRFNNHRTRDERTMHKEQRLSATYYALTKVGIPAFAIETSNSIPDYQMRVTYQTMVVNAFLDEFGVIREHPKVSLENPYLKYLIVSINGRTPIVASARDLLKTRKGDRLQIVHIESNYSRGLTASIKGSRDSLNYLGREIALWEDMVLEIRKDRFLIAAIPVEVMKEAPLSDSAGVHFEPRIDYFCVRVNNRTLVLEPGKELIVFRGDQLVILDPKTNLAPEDEKTMRIDLRGFQAGDSPYPTEDRGHVINTEKDLQQEYGRVAGPFTVFALQAKLGKRVFGQGYIAVAEPKLDYLVLKTDRAAGFVVYPGDKLEAPESGAIQIMDVRTNLPDETPLFITMSGRTVPWVRSGSAGIDPALLAGQETPLDITREGRSIGRIWLRPGKEFALISGGKQTPVPILPVRHSDRVN